MAFVMLSDAVINSVCLVLMSSWYTLIYRRICCLCITCAYCKKALAIERKRLAGGMISSTGESRVDSAGGRIVSVEKL